MTSSVMVQHIYSINKPVFWFIIALNILVAMTDIIALVLLQYLTDIIAEPSNIDKTRLYILVLLIGISWFLKSCLIHNLWLEAALIIEDTRQGLNLMMYEKISRLSQNIVDGQEIGKITNIFSNDFNKLAARFPSIISGFGHILRIIGIIIILIVRLGWMAISLIFIFVLFSLLQIVLGKL